MSKMKKIKVFKKVFDLNTDDFNIDKEPVMTRSTFIAIAGEMYAASKKRYFTKHHSVTVEFAEWYHFNIPYNKEFTVKEAYKEFLKRNENEKLGKVRTKRNSTSA